ncbi:hypothetical protein GGR54DRAFT_612245 [Hypoxylon sp. NC1633]|nr:hypothetical protein GGR54DRAFT_612245 [Hypoxylon sp. NC1633]
MSWQLYTPENAHLDPLASFRGYSLVNTILRQHGLFPYEVFYVHHLSSKRRPQRASIWVVDLMSPAGPNNFPVEAKPFTTPLHWTGADRLIIRILLPTCPNLVHKNRIVNEVASMHLIRQGLKKAPDGLADVVPAVYSWGVSKADPEKGWMIMEYKRGLRLNSILPTMDQEAVDIAIGRIAQLLSYIQKTPLPATNAHTGGLALDLDGKVKLGNMTTLPGGPWDSYSGFWAAKINAQLAHAKLSAQVDRPNYSIREETRLLCQAHLRDISQLFHNSLVDEGARAMIHGSLSKFSVNLTCNLHANTLGLQRWTIFCMIRNANGLQHSLTLTLPASRIRRWSFSHHSPTLVGMSCATSYRVLVSTTN